MDTIGRMESMRRVVIGGAALVSLLVVDVALAAGLAPKRPSDVVTLKSSLAACQTGGQVLDVQIGSDGNRRPFSIPVGKALVVTGIEWAADPSPQLFLTVGLAHGITGENVFLTSSPAGTLGGGGQERPWASGHAAVPNVVFSSGSEICAVLSNGILPSPVGTIIVHGFLSQDR